MSKSDQKLNTRLEHFIAEQGVIITLVPRSVQLHFEEAIDASLTRTLSMRLDLDPEEDVQLPDGRSLKMLSWTMTLIEGSIYNELATKEGAIGLVFHLKESAEVIDGYSPESFHVGSALKPEKFSTLIEAIQNGRLPDQIQITVRGLKYGWCPDGSLKVWDIKTNPDAFLINMQFNIPLIITGERFSDSNDKSLYDDRFPATSGDIRALEQKLTESFTELHHEAQKRWIGLVCLLLVAIVILFFRS